MKTWRQLTVIRRVLAGLVLCMASAGATAADVYVCVVNGTKTFVDSPRACPEAEAERLKGRREQSEVRRPSTSGPGAQRRASGAIAQAPAASSPSCDERKHPDADALRACLKQERRAQVRRLATARLAAIARAIATYVSNPNPAEPAVPVAISKGRPAVWCEELLSDVMAQRQVEVVDDEDEVGPKWSEWFDQDGRKSRRAVEILDPGFSEWVTAKGRKVVGGYVTVRWRGDNMLVLRASPGCGPADHGVVDCAPSLYAAIYVHETAFPVACNVMLIGSRYWNTWPGAVRINPKVPTGLVR
jgi:hypothetical protein